MDTHNHRGFLRLDKDIIFNYAVQGIQFYSEMKGSRQKIIIEWMKGVPFVDTQVAVNNNTLFTLRLEGIWIQFKGSFESFPMLLNTEWTRVKVTAWIEEDRS